MPDHHLELNKILTSHFGLPFDLEQPPDGFRWSIDLQPGDWLDLHNLFWGSPALDAWIAHRATAQGSHEPIVLWRRARKPWLALLRALHVRDDQHIAVHHYHGWCVVSLARLLSVTDTEFWFRGTLPNPVSR